MQRIYSTEVPKYNGKKALVAGWVSDIRDLGGLKFFILRDKEGILQVTMPKKKVPAEVMKVADSVTKESVVQAEGTVKEAKQAPGGFELVPEKLELVSKAEQYR